MASAGAMTAHGQTVTRPLAIFPGQGRLWKAVSAALGLTVPQLSWTQTSSPHRQGAARCPWQDSHSTGPGSGQSRRRPPASWPLLLCVLQRGRAASLSRRHISPSMDSANLSQATYAPAAWGKRGVRWPSDERRQRGHQAGGDCSGPPAEVGKGLPPRDVPSCALRDRTFCPSPNAPRIAYASSQQTPQLLLAQQVGLFAHAPFRPPVLFPAGPCGAEGLSKRNAQGPISGPSCPKSFEELILFCDRSTHSRISSVHFNSTPLKHLL